MMKKITLMVVLSVISFGYSQGPLPYDFGTAAMPTTHGMAANGDPMMVVINDVDPDDASNSVLSITEVNGATWDNAQVTFAAPIDLSDNDNNTIQFRIRATTSAPMEVRQHGLAFQNGGASVSGSEFNFDTTGTGDWETITIDFPSGLGTFESMVFFTDVGTFGVGGDNFNTGTYLIDDIILTSTPCSGPEFPINFDVPEDLFDIPGGATVTIVSEEMEVIGDGSSWDNAHVAFCDPIDLSNDSSNTLSFDVRSTTAMPGEVHTHLVSFQPVNGTASEMNFTTTGTDPTFVQLDFGPGLATYTNLVVFPDSPTLGVFADNFDGGTYIFDNFMLGPTLSVNDNSLQEFKAFPNPTQDNWTISANQEILSIEVFDMLGKRVMELKPENSIDVIISASEFNSGLYFAKITTPLGSKSIKLIKK